MAATRRNKPEASAYQQALALLVRREHSRKELARKLRSRGIETDEAEQALEKLSRQDFQNDERFAEALARTRAAAGLGPQRIRAELGMHGLSRETVAVALEACDRDWVESAVNLLERRFPRGLLDSGNGRRAYEFLLRRGYDARQIRQASALLGAVVADDA